MGTFEQMGRNVGRNVDNKVNYTREQLQKAKNAGVEYGRSIAGKAAETRNKITKGASKTMKKAEESARSTLKSAKQTISANYNTIRSKSTAIARDVQSVVEKAGNLSEKAAYTMVAAGLTLGNSVKSSAIDTTNGVINFTLKNKEVVRVKIAQPAINSVKSAGKALGTAYNSAQKQAQLMAETAKNRVNKTAAEAFKKGSIALSEMADDFKSASKKIEDDGLGTFIGGAVQKRLNATKKELELLGDKGKKTYKNIIKNVKAAGNRGAEVAVASIQAVKDYGDQIKKVTASSVNRVVVVTLNTGEKVSYEVADNFKSASKKIEDDGLGTFIKKAGEKVKRGAVNKSKKAAAASIQVAAEVLDDVGDGAKSASKALSDTREKLEK